MCIRDRNNLALAYSDQGKFSGAEVLFKQCLDKQKEVLGENHPTTLNTMGNVGKASIEKLRSYTSSA